MAITIHLTGCCDGTGNSGRVRTIVDPSDPDDVITSSDYYLICDPDGDETWVMPDPSETFDVTANTGQEFYIKNKSNHLVTIDRGGGGDLIILNEGDVLHIISTGSQYNVLGFETV